MKLILILPLIIYIGIVLVNFDILWKNFEINLFGIQTLNLPWLFINTIFIITYTLILILIFESRIGILRIKNRNLEKKLIYTKAQLYDGQEKLLNQIKNFFEIKLNEKENNLEKKLNQIIEKQNYNFEKYQEKFEEILKQIKNINQQTLNQIHNESKKALEKLDLVDENILDKFKQLVKK